MVCKLGPSGMLLHVGFELAWVLAQAFSSTMGVQSRGWPSVLAKALWQRGV